MRGSLWGSLRLLARRTFFDDTKNHKVRGFEGDKKRIVKTQMLQLGNCCLPDSSPTFFLHCLHRHAAAAQILARLGPLDDLSPAAD